MKTTHTKTESGAVTVARKYTANKISKDVYKYRGWLIRKWDNNYLNDSDVRGYQWNTYRNNDEMAVGNSCDIADTLRGAKMYIDICVKRDLEEVGNKSGVVTESEFEIIRNDNPNVTVRLAQSGGETYYFVGRRDNGVVYDLVKYFRPIL